MWAFGFGGAWNCEQVIGSVAIAKSIRQGNVASLCCSWNLAYLRTTSPPLRGYFLSSPPKCWYYRQVQIVFFCFNFFVLFCFCFFCYHSQNSWFHQGKIKTHVPYCWWIRSPSSSLLYVGVWLLCFLVWTWYCTKSLYWLALPNNFWQRWGVNLAMRHWEAW